MTPSGAFADRLRRRHPRSRRNLRRNDFGDAVIEFAILAGPILIATFLVIQAAIVFYARINTLAAATQGANAARAHESSTTVGHDKAMQFLEDNNFGFRNPNVTVESNGIDVVVTVNATAVSVIPFMSFNVTQRAGGPVERFVE